MASMTSPELRTPSRRRTSDGQSALLKVLRGISSFRQQVQAVADRHEAAVPEILTLVDVLEAEAKAALSEVLDVEVPSLSTERSYESMRQALQEMQKRSETLVARLQKESEVNLELSKARQSAEETSRKLSVQVTQQVEELNHSVSQRLLAEQQLEDSRARNRIEVELREEDFRRRLASAQKEADERCEGLQKGLVNKLHLTQKAMEKVKSYFYRLRADHADSRKAVLMLNEAMSQFMMQTERTISQRIEALVKSHIEQRVSSSDANRELELRIFAEQEFRFSEVASLSERYAHLQQERDRIQASLSHDVAQLSVQLEDYRRRRLEEGDLLRAEAQELRACEARQLALSSEQAETIEQLRSAGQKRDSVVSSQEQELLRCQSELQLLRSKGSEQSAEVQRQQQELERVRLELAEAQGTAVSVAKERDRLSLQALELKKCQELIEERQLSDQKHVDLLSIRQEELKRCESELLQLRSRSSEQSVEVQRQQQELQSLRVEMLQAQQETRHLNEEREAFLAEKDELLTTEAMQLLLVSQRAEELQHCREELARSQAQVQQGGAEARRSGEELREQRAELRELRMELKAKEQLVDRFEEARSDLVLSENLREHLCEQRRSSSKSWSVLQRELESHIQRLQRHSEDLRGEFR